MHFSIPSCHGEGVSMDGRCQEKWRVPGQIQRSCALKRKKPCTCAVQHQYVLQVDMIELKLVSRGPRIKMKRLIQNRAVSVKR